MYYLVYKTTNIINGKFYIGAHRTKNIQDAYLGSGVALDAAIKKYGVENFTKEILFQAKNESEMFDMERQLISENIGENCYNMMHGGKGGFDHINSTDMHRGSNNCMHDPHIKSKVTESAKRTRLKNKEKYDNISKENLKKAVEKNTGRKRPEHSDFMKTWSKQNWEKNKDKIRDALSSTFELTSPAGIVYTTNRLQDFCKEHDLTYTSVWITTITNKPVKKGKSKGWLCKKI
jgi:hypothetical protein